MRTRVPVLLMARELGLGGSERQLCELARRLDREQFEPHVAAFNAAGVRAEELRAVGIPILELPVRSFLSISLLRGLLSLGAYVRRHQIQIVHTFDVPLNLFGAPAARTWRVPAVLSSQRAHRDLTPGLRRHLLRLTDQIVDGIIVNSLSVRRQLIEEDRVPPHRIHFCRNGVDAVRFAPAPRCRPAALDGAGLVVAAVCACRPEKDLATLLAAFAAVCQSASGLKLLIVGSGPALPGLLEQSVRLGIRPDCHFEPATANVVPWLRAADIFVLPSLSEASSNSLMEAMASGCCAIASRAGGNPELVADGETGLLFDPGDVAGLARCVRAVIADAGLRDRLAACGAARIRRDFSLESAARRMAEIYTEVLATSAGRPGVVSA